MKNLKKIVCLAVLLTLMAANVSFADELSWETAPGHHNQSVLLGEEFDSAEDSVQRYGRGEYLAGGSVEIENLHTGDIYVSITTLAYRNVDRISHTVFLDRWSDSRNDWINLGYWDFEKTKEEANNDLHSLTTSFTLTGYDTGEYYRVRGLHLVEFEGDAEGCATETNGVLITDN